MRIEKLTLSLDDRESTLVEVTPRAAGTEIIEGVLRELTLEERKEVAAFMIRVRKALQPR